MMKKKLPIILAAISIPVFLFAASGTAAAALSYVSENYIAQMDIKSIGVSLVENGSKVSWRDYTHKDDAWSQGSGELLGTMLSDAGDEQLIFNKKYPEKLSVTNSGTIDEYVRVTVYKYWENIDDGTKRTDLDPSMIQIGFTGNGWIEDTSAATTEKNVFYYDKILATGENSTAFTDTISINGEIARKVTETETTDENGNTNVICTYEYDGARFVLRADVDAVQTHNAQDAIMSAWGISVSIGADGSLSLK
jgi:hypothetical protein